MAKKNDKFTYRVTWSEDDAEYVGLCAEFPSLSWLAQTPEAALKGIRKLVGEVISDMLSNEESVPEPIATKHFSGKFMVRVPPDEHRELAIQAAEAGVSLNRLASAKLSPLSICKSYCHCVKNNVMLQKLLSRHRCRHKNMVNKYRMFSVYYKFDNNFYYPF